MRTTARIHLSHALAALAVLYLLGIGLARTGGLASVGDAILYGSKLNAPVAIVAAQLLGGLVALRARGRRATAGAVLLLLACAVSLVAVAFDGDIGAARLSPGQVAYQAIIAATTAGALILGLRRLRPGQ
jgi:hypothetical protein